MMDDPKEQGKQPGLDVDIFSSQPGARKESDAGVAAAGVVKKSRLSRLGPVPFVIAAVVVAVAWIGWPYLFSGSSGDSSATVGMLTPDRAIGDASPDRMQGQPQMTASVASAPDVTASNTSALAAASAPGAASDPASRSIVAAASTSDTGATQFPTREKELQATVDDLQVKLAAAEGRGKACPAPAQVTRVATAGARHLVRHTKRTPRAQAVAAKPDTVEGRKASFTLNTVYRDQAWIQDAERTYIVQAGDVIDGMRVVRVDAATREVVTSSGVIR